MAAIPKNTMSQTPKTLNKLVDVSVSE